MTISNLSTFGLALCTGIVASVVSSIITARIALDDRKAKADIAKEDREAALRRDACIDLETQRILELEAISSLERHSLANFSIATKPASPPERNIRSEAAISLVLSEVIEDAVEMVNDIHRRYIGEIHRLKSEPPGPYKQVLRDNATDIFKEYCAMAEKLRTLLREEVITFSIKK